MAYGMSAAKEAGLANTQVWKRLMGMSVDQLKAAAHGEVPGVDMNLATLALRSKMTGVAEQGAKAQQQLAQGKQTVKDRIMAQADQALPEMLGIGRLPAENMEQMAAAQGGLMSYADGGEVSHFEQGGSAFSRWWDRINAGSPAYVQQENQRAALGPSGGFLGMFKEQTDEEYEAAKKKRDALIASGVIPPTAPKAAPPAAAAPSAAPAAAALKDAPKDVKTDVVKLAQPKVPVADPTKAQEDNMDAEISRLDKMTSYLDKKFGGMMDPIKAQLEKDRAEYANMKSENVGLALLGAAGALLKPGRTTASAIGEGLSTLGEYGMKFQPQLLAARQGISAGEVGLAQAEAQAARGNFATAAQLQNQREQAAIEREKLAMQRPYYAAYANMLNAKGSGVGGGAQLGQLKALQSSLQAQLKGLQGKVDPDSKAQAALIQQQLAQVTQRLSSVAGLDLTTGFMPSGGGSAIRSSLFE